MATAGFIGLDGVRISREADAVNMWAASMTISCIARRPHVTTGNTLSIFIATPQIGYIMPNWKFMKSWRLSISGNESDGHASMR